jgi:hypothetical protein
MLNVATSQMDCSWELRTSVLGGKHLIPETAADGNPLFRFDPRYFRGGQAC